MKVFLQGHGEVSLSQNDFVATGGQASVYVKGGMAYKIYIDPKDAIPPEKFLALAAITDPSVVKPKTLLLDGKNQRIGYAMDAVTAPHSLCQLFTPAFRSRHKVGDEKIPRLVGKLRSHVLSVHQAGIVVVDLNELNVLVPDSFDETFLIDVDSYQTSQFPATVIMPSVRDWAASKFTAESDWYSYAILAFQLFVGAHPFKGSLQHPELAAVPKDERLEWRMRRNLSAFRAEASLPACCPPFSVIPDHFRDWLVAVLDQGKRLPPPDPGTALPAIPVRATARVLGSSEGLRVELVVRYDGFIAVADESLVLLRSNGVASLKCGHCKVEGAWMQGLATGQTLLGFTPRMKCAVALRLDRGRLSLYDFERKVACDLDWDVSEIAKGADRFYVRMGSRVYELAFVETGARIVLVLDRQVADVLPRASRLFEGCAVQSLLGSTFVSLFPKSRQGYQVRIGELDGVKVLDAKFQAHTGGGLLMAIGARAGKYSRFVFRFDDGYDRYDARVVDDVEPDLVNFVVLPNSGITACLVEGDALEVFVATRGKTAVVQKIDSPVLGKDLRLCLVGDGIGFTRGSELYRLRLS